MRNHVITYGQKIIALLLLLFSLPILVIAMCVIWLESDGGVIFRQIRVGKDQKHFVIYKLRTMISTPSTKKDALFGSKESCVTIVGRILRVLKIDELPQLVNVLKGDMNLVGPRPVRVQLHDYYLEHIIDFGKRYQVAPGIVGISQLVDPKDRNRALGVHLDLYYIQNRSLKLDLQILSCTTTYLVFSIIEIIYRRMQKSWLNKISINKIPADIQNDNFDFKDLKVIVGEVKDPSVV